MSGGALMPVRLAYISGGFPVWALFVGQSQGLFAQQGLALEVTHTGSSVAQMNGLREGRFDIGLQLPDHVVRATATGCPLAVLAAQTHAPDVALVARPDVTGLPALRGHRIAVDGARSGYALLLRRLLQGQGLQAGDYELVEVGGSQERVQALREGSLAASFINPPLDRTLVAEGFVRLTSTRAAFPDYPGPVCAARRDWIAAQPQAVAAFQTAWRQAWAWLLEPAHEAQALEIAVASLQADATSAQRALAGLRAQGQPQITPAGLLQVIELVWASETLPGEPPTPEQLMA